MNQMPVTKPTARNKIKVVVHVQYEIEFKDQYAKEQAIKALENETPWQLMSSAGFSVKQLPGNTVHE